MISIQKIYSFLIENIVLRIFGSIYSDPILSHLKNLKKISKQSEFELSVLQSKKINKLLKYSANNIDFYKDYKLNEDEKYDIKSFPIVDKIIIRDFKDQLINKKIPVRKLIRHLSSGSSGIQSEIFCTKEEQSKVRAMQLLWWQWAGYKIGQPTLQTGMSQRTFLKTIKDFFFRIKYLNAYNHSDEDLYRALKWAKNKNVFMGGYSSSLYILSLFSKNNIKVKFSGAVSWGDKLFKHYKTSINSIFDVNVKETYGTAELIMLAAQYDLDYMYIMSNNVFIEILDDNGIEVKDGEMGNVVVTNLNAYAMPLIRYKIGDLAIKLPRNLYPEERKLNFPILQKVVGRDTDIIKTKSGKKLTVHSFTAIFEYYQEIIQFCIIQNNLESLLIKIIISDSFTDDVLNSLKIKLMALSNHELELKFERTDYISPTPSGKPQIIISSL